MLWDLSENPTWVDFTACELKIQRQGGFQVLLDQGTRSVALQFPDLLFASCWCEPQAESLGTKWP